ncbi:NAD-dependent epimerase/dehydratase family protein [Alisedimentitalea sp. MJ-SS2]|uniref:NAD-dependent epimerase/dehydratase family protein n=1 Tax=Aliisedimentitalea sp. MJ-SS2 TaxID=3049795 RepID=UPI00290829E9|nr:NAD-dependent epimerase/dehydratase family protein [Alisedimentitalea sp. MJ-SS2]MDU8929431.1 NAD-dependent epimerase/dehydratase family protein [Alisedimentitalea sp. MJ-SS2]
MPKSQHKRHVLVLGASGKIGRMLHRWWQANPPTVIAPLWQYRENPEQGGVIWWPGSTAPQELPAISAVVALWGVTPGEGRDLAKNSPLARAAIDLATTLGADRVLHCSTAAVYTPASGALKESDAGVAPNPYGAAKLDMENTIVEHNRHRPGAPANTVLRIGNVSGADSLFAAMTSTPNRVTLDRFATGHGPMRSYISPVSLARVIEALVTCPLDQLPAVLNVATPNPVAMEAIARACGRDVTWKPAPDSAAPMVWLDTTELDRIIHLEDETPEQIATYWTMLKDPE